MSGPCVPSDEGLLFLFAHGIVQGQIVFYILSAGWEPTVTCFKRLCRQNDLIMITQKYANAFVRMLTLHIPCLLRTAYFGILCS
jgi:hypothetical protein